MYNTCEVVVAAVDAQTVPNILCYIVKLSPEN